MNTESKRTIPEIHIDTLTLYERLKKVSSDDPIISYIILSEAIGQDVRNEAYSKLYTAKNRLMRDDGIRFEAIRGVGLKRMSDREVGLSGESELKKLRRTARRGVKKLSCIQNFDGLSNEVKTKCLASRALLGVVHEFAKPKQMKKLEIRADEQQGQISMRTTIDALMG